jgi:hypothetical protein
MGGRASGRAVGLRGKGMSIRRILFEAGNKALHPLGLCLGRTEADFQTTVPQGSLQKLIKEALTVVWGRWYDATAADSTVLYPPSITKEDFTSRIIRFVDEYREFNGKNTRSGGLFLNNTISLFAAATYFDPPTLIDSGTYTGNSAWALSRACPSGDIHSFDITHIALRHRVPRATYHLGDWAGFFKEPLPGRPVFAFFDDHVDQIRRIEECAERNVRIVVFDDDTPVNATHNGHNEHSFPKASFAFWESARTVKALNWELRGRKFEVPIDGARLEHARGLIAHYSRLPDLYPVTGFTHQWPLSMAILR